MRYILLLFVLLMVGCASWDDVMDGWIGKPFARIQRLWGEPDRAWKRTDGKMVYMYYVEDIDHSCVHYWVVNSEEVIVDSRHKGFCYPIQ